MLICDNSLDNQDFWIRFRHISQLGLRKYRQQFGGSLSIFAEDVYVKHLVLLFGHGVECRRFFEQNSLVRLISKKLSDESTIQGVKDTIRSHYINSFGGIYSKNPQ